MSISRYCAPLIKELGPLGYPLFRHLSRTCQRVEIPPGRFNEFLDSKSPSTLVQDVLDEDILPHQLDHDDVRSVDDISVEWEQTTAIAASARICAEEHDHEAEWNTRVHSRVLDHVFDRASEHQVGFRTVYVSATILSLFFDYLY
jgi:hypothetical protein